MKHYVILLFICLFLQGCVGTQQQAIQQTKNDGAPAFHVSVEKIPDPKPKKEPPSRYGNMKKYTVAGREYKTMSSSEGYREIGLASWYGTKFHGRPTSSMEPYDMLAMTAAHKKLPLPTYVRVTNLENQKSVIVRVNDRGPFVDDRIIDLSYVAAKKLDIIGNGVARVEVRAIEPLTEESYAYYLQMGVFTEHHNAQRMVQEVKTALTNDPDVLSMLHLNDKDNAYRVWIGPFTNIDHKRAVQKVLVNKGFSKPTVIEG